MKMSNLNKNYTCDYCDGFIVSGTGYIDESDGFAVHYNCWFESIKDKVKKAVYDAKLAKTFGPSKLSWTIGAPPSLEEKEPTWKTKDGKVILISEMTDSHLLAAANKLKTTAVNAIMLKGGGTTVTDYLKNTKYSKLIEEIKKRGLSYDDKGNQDK